MNKKQFINRHCHFPEHNEVKFTADLDTLLEEAYEKGRKKGLNHGI